MQSYEVELTGTSPLLQHRMPKEELMKLLGAKDKKKKIKEICTPREIAERHAYTDNGHYAIPLEYVRQAFKGASSEYKQTHSSRKSYKPIAPAIFRPSKTMTPLLDMKNKPVKDFEVDIQKATNHLKGAVAVCRPRFDRWRVKFSVDIDTDLISEEVALQILQDAGHRVGIGSYRVVCGGYFGQFEVTKWKRLRS